MIFNINSTRGQTRFLTCVARVTCLVIVIDAGIVRTQNVILEPTSRPSDCYCIWKDLERLAREEYEFFDWLTIISIQINEPEACSHATWLNCIWWLSQCWPEMIITTWSFIGCDENMPLKWSDCLIAYKKCFLTSTVWSFRNFILLSFFV